MVIYHVERVNFLKKYQKVLSGSHLNISLALKFGEKLLLQKKLQKSLKQNFSSAEIFFHSCKEKRFKLKARVNNFAAGKKKLKMVFNYNRKIESESDTAPFSGTRKSKIFILAGNSSPTKIEENLVEEPGKWPAPFEKIGLKLTTWS